MGRNYYLGLDMGTSSVGWAVTDENYKILRAKGKDMWGIREFEEAVTSVERRTNRVSRRRRQREVARIGLLKEYFHDAINAVDPAFYSRMENSKYWLEDKDECVRTSNALFNDPNYTDKEYFKQFPTIFHLRKELIDNPKPHDVRLVYLAVLNMYKHRGHFLNASLSSNESVISVDDAYKSLIGVLENAEMSLTENVDIKQLGNILGSRDYSRTQKAEQMATLLSVEKKDKKHYSLIKMICGLKVSSADLFGDDDSEKTTPICFSEYNFDEKKGEIQEAIGEDLFEIVEAAHSLYNAGTLSAILKGKKYLSEARVEDYQKHAADLKLLKAVVRKYDKDGSDYDSLFRDYGDGSYSAYIGSVNSKNKGKKRRNVKGDRNSFYASLKKTLKKYPQEDKNVIRILEEMDKETFLLKQLTAANGVIPNQVHDRELKRILENASAYLPFLNDVDESGFSVKERIEKLFSFQIPYYIGPVTEKSALSGGNGWVVRKESGPVYPWNYEKKIDVDKTSVEFIKRLIRECTYLSGEKVMPKASLMYEKYCVLNEINNIRIRGERIDVEAKQALYHELFERGKKVTKHQLCKWFVNRRLIDSEDELSGVDISINNSLSTYGKFLPILGDKLKEDKYKAIVENIVELATIYGDAKEWLRNRITAEYGNIFDEAQIKRILGFKFKDWGRLSKEFLELQGCNKETGEETTIIRTLWETSYNLMEIINNDGEFTFREVLEEKKTNSIGSLSELKYEDLEEMYFSAPVRRMVWQTLLIVKEIEKVMGCAPSRLFIEMTRSEGEKKRTKSRKQKFIELYKSIKEDRKKWTELIESADNDGRLKSKKMYLYLTQMGKCMYSGEDISLDDLFDDNKYDIDHIYPRHFVKDDNIENNLVLVKKTINNEKQDNFPLPESIHKKCSGLWLELLSSGLISKEKYDRLISRQPLTDSQKADFIARQLVETSQGTKSVAELIKQVIAGKTTVVYSKASNVSDFRQEYDIPKSRLVNDFHHAHDAYLNIVVGNVYYTKFTQNPRHFIEREYRNGATYNLGKMYEWDVKRGETIAWISSRKNNPGTISTVRAMLSKQTPLLTRMNFEQHGALANATLYGREKATPDKYVPLKTSDLKMEDVTKYGGYTSVSGAYFFLVESDEKGKRIRTLETLPIALSQKCEQNETELLNYCKNELALINPSIRMPKIKYQSLIKLNGYNVHLSGRTGEQLIIRNAVSLKLSKDMIATIKAIEKSVETGRVDKKIDDNICILIFDELVEKYSNGVLSMRPNNVVHKISGNRNVYIALETLEKCKVILQMIQLYKVGVAFGDLSLIELAPKSGVMLMSKKIQNNNECLLINQSITGLYENTIDLLKV